MAYDAGLAQILRDALQDEGPIEEKRMMGGLCFLSQGHMLCGVHKDGAMVRVGKPNYQAALSLPGVGPMMFTGREMAGLVDISPEALADDLRREALLAMARDFVSTLPPK